MLLGVEWEFPQDGSIVGPKSRVSGGNEGRYIQRRRKRKHPQREKEQGDMKSKVSVHDLISFLCKTTPDDAYRFAYAGSAMAAEPEGTKQVKRSDEG